MAHGLKIPPCATAFFDSDYANQRNSNACEFTPPRLSKLKTRLKDAAQEAGNVLFMILIAVALFAALAYTVSQSTRSGGGDASQETASLTAAGISQYATSIDTAIMRMKISNNCTDEQISFENPFFSGYVNANSPVNYTCHVFRPEGGNVIWQNNINWFDSSPLRSNPITEYGWREPGFSGFNKFPGHGLESKTELTFALMEVPKGVCIELNKRFNVNAASDTDESDPWIPREQNWFSYNKFTGHSSDNGSYRDDPAGNQRLETTDGGPTDPVWGKKAACVEGEGSGGYATLFGTENYYFIYVLLAR